MSLLVAAVLLALPVYAVQRLGPGFYWLGIYALVLSAITCWRYAVDKRRAEEGSWRVPEAQLHLLELLGGWPGAFLSQRRLRHKCSKGSYQFVFWFIVIIHQFVAFDSLHNWQISREVGSRLERTLEHRR